MSSGGHMEESVSWELVPAYKVLFAPQPCVATDMGLSEVTLLQKN